jgi:NAD(P)-dependent dehydrogenase (short-subunit alcohol dehydrogenase family)
MSKNILITGCSSGIGLYSARMLKLRGHRVFATARKKEDVKMLQDEGFEAFKLDVRKEESIDKALDSILELTDGGLDVLFNNAGYGQVGALEDISTDVLRKQFETNVFGAHSLIQKVLPIMHKQNSGRIINHSSILGLISLRFRGAYNASKYAIEGLSDTLRLELSDTNIKVITLNTGPINSKFRDNSIKTLKKIDIENSRFEEYYQSKEKTKGENDIWTLGNFAMGDSITDAIESSCPDERYYITAPSRFLSFFKRILPTSCLDTILLKIT